MSMRLVLCPHCSHSDSWAAGGRRPPARRFWRRSERRVIKLKIFGIFFAIVVSRYSCRCTNSHGGGGSGGDTGSDVARACGTRERGGRHTRQVGRRIGRRVGRRPAAAHFWAARIGVVFASRVTRTLAHASRSDRSACQLCVCVEKIVSGGWASAHHADVMIFFIDDPIVCCLRTHKTWSPALGHPLAPNSIT